MGTADYEGEKDCNAACAVPGAGPKACQYGCLGFGSCVAACEFDAIHLVRVDDTQWANDMAHWYGRLAKNVVKRGANIVAHGVSEMVKRS